jgi:hypothetical protein
MGDVEATVTALPELERRRVSDGVRAIVKAFGSLPDLPDDVVGKLLEAASLLMTKSTIPGVNVNALLLEAMESAPTLFGGLEP